MGFVATKCSSESSDSSSTNETTAKNTLKSKDPTEKIIISATEDLDITAEQITNIKNTLEQCDVMDIESVEHDEMLDNAHSEGETGYRIGTKHANNIILYLNSDNSVYSIRYADKDMYINNAVVDKISNHILTDEERSNLSLMCQETIKKILISPKSAKFPLYPKWAMAKSDGIILIQSYVDSKNAFGVEIRNEFYFKIDSASMKILSLIFDGEELIKQ